MSDAVILAIKDREGYSEVHAIPCNVLDGEVTAWQMAYDSLLLVGESGLTAALRRMARKGREPRLQPCCIPLDDDGGRIFPMFPTEEAAELWATCIDRAGEAEDVLFEEGDEE